jgi:peptide/nickel transport system substrate-binding protein
MRRKTSWLFSFAILLAAAALCAAPGASDTPKRGGVLRIGMIGEPPTLDAHVTTATITREIGINMFETLFALDAKYQPAPLLVEGYEVQDGGKRYVFRLDARRKDVQGFQNGPYMHFWNVWLDR